MKEFLAFVNSLCGVPIDARNDAWVFETCADARRAAKMAAALDIKVFISADFICLEREQQ